MKLDFPKFDGTNALDWIFQAEEFFNFHGTLPPLRLQITLFHMVGRAVAWYQWMKRNNMLTTWPEFLLALRYRFEDSVYEDYPGRLSKL